MHNYVLDSNTILCTNLQTLYTEGLERLQRRQDYTCHTESDGVIACCGLRIKIFPKMEKFWTELPGLFNYLSFNKSWHGVKVSK